MSRTSDLLIELKTGELGLRIQRMTRCFQERGVAWSDLKLQAFAEQHLAGSYDRDDWCEAANQLNREAHGAICLSTCVGLDLVVKAAERDGFVAASSRPVELARSTVASALGLAFQIGEALYYRRPSDDRLFSFRIVRNRPDRVAVSLEN